MIVVGLSSGTSVDGIDVAAAGLEIGGGTVTMAPLGHLEVPFEPELRAAVLEALPPAATTLGAVARIDTGLGHAFAAAARTGIDELTGGRADLVASHGQTLFHDVEDGAVLGTLQLGQPAWIAQATGLPVVSDLRARDVAAGGHGAPLASVLDVLLLGDRAEAAGGPVAALNLGGIANVTVVGAGPAAAFDTGPANALLDAAARATTGAHQDTGGVRAARGTVDAGALARLVAEPYYRLPPPKSTGKELFDPAYTARVLDGHPVLDRPDDLLATLVELTAGTVADALAPYGVREVLVSGGGARNPAVVAALERRLAPARLAPVSDAGLPGDGKEALLFALLGFLTWHGVASTVPSCTGAREPTIAGRISPGAAPLRLPAPAEPPLRLRLRLATGRAGAPPRPD
ncbi:MULTISPECIES: anhydro-N-acetylmuramic acid kinase [unclassified Pseudonocardia]|uniref:anhydro-N-acetylmuramic acid kinase n=1 Tax=unclassified Pseudonocardia TaxID=2619320 RepID=UPI0001FFE84E|nr:anhydro-N-acetylmuramic acid kinase [Pseudonocardia sp. Ae707_Ps1]OLM18745.1 Anhydro-N-acetylmuramic acid kinase [Pseudonocardia sp. Ae707_Ps1]